MTWTRVGEDQLVHDGWLRIVRRRYVRADGRESEWEVLARVAIVSVLALTPQGRVVMVRQFRTGPDRAVVNLPGGVIDPGETAAEAAARELTEETGYVAGSIDIVATFHPMAHGDWVKHVAIARDCTPTGVQRLDEGEDCVPVLMRPEEVRAAVRAGDLVGTDAIYVGLDHAGLL